jgi:hypothetical protein
MEQQNQTNRWKEFHNSLDIDDAKAYRQQIERLLGISPGAFCRKINKPQQLNYAEKQLIGRVYRVKKEYLFPEIFADAAKAAQVVLIPDSRDK